MLRTSFKPLSHFTTSPKPKPLSYLSKITNRQLHSTTKTSACSPKWAILDRFISLNPTITNQVHLDIKTPPSNLSKLTIPPSLTDKETSLYILSNSSNINTFNNKGLLLFAAIKGRRDPFKERTPTSFDSRTTLDHLFLYKHNHNVNPLPDPPELIMHRGCIGFVGQNDDYVVLEYQPILTTTRAFMMVYDSRTGVWKKYNVNYPREVKDHFWRADGTFSFEGKVFWVDLSAGLVVCDEPFGERFNDGCCCCRFVALPKGSKRMYYDKSVEVERWVGPSGGFVRYVEVSPRGEFVGVRMWRLENCDQWVLEHKVEFKEIWGDESYKSAGIPVEIIPIESLSD